MRFTRNIALLVCLACLSMPTSLVASKTGKDLENNRKIAKLCQQLKIPYNEEANLKLLEFTKEWKGTPYCFGGNTKKGVDCSAFTGHAYSQVYNKTIPRVSRDIYSKTMPLRKYALYEGDLVFFATSGGTRISHVGIYLWDGYFAHASSSKGVTISNLKQGYYVKTFVSGGAWLD